MCMRIQVPAASAASDSILRAHIRPANKIVFVATPQAQLFCAPAIYYYCLRRAHGCTFLLANAGVCTIDEWPYYFWFLFYCIRLRAADQAMPSSILHLPTLSYKLMFSCLVWAPCNLCTISGYFTNPFVHSRLAKSHQRERRAKHNRRMTYSATVVGTCIAHMHTTGAMRSLRQCGTHIEHIAVVVLVTVSGVLWRWAPQHQDCW